MASFDLPELPAPKVSPQLLMGVASPLWTYFGAAAASGMAYWWMTQWARPVNLEAMLGAAKVLPAPVALPAPVVEATEAVSEAAETVVEAVAEIVPEPITRIASEAAAISPLVEAQPDAAPESFAETATPVFDAAPEPVLDEPAPFLAEPMPEPAPKIRARKIVPPAVDPEA